MADAAKDGKTPMAQESADIMEVAAVGGAPEEQLKDHGGKTGVCHPTHTPHTDTAPVGAFELPGCGRRRRVWQWLLLGATIIIYVSKIDWGNWRGWTMGWEDPTEDRRLGITLWQRGKLYTVHGDAPPRE